MPLTLLVLALCSSSGSEASGRTMRGSAVVSPRANILDGIIPSAKVGIASREGMPPSQCVGCVDPSGREGFPDALVFLSRIQFPLTRSHRPHSTADITATATAIRRPGSVK